MIRKWAMGLVVFVAGLTVAVAQRPGSVLSQGAKQGSVAQYCGFTSGVPVLCPGSAVNTTSYNTATPYTNTIQTSSSRTFAGFTGTNQIWLFNSAGFYQYDTLANMLAFSSLRTLNLPTNCVPTGGLKVVVFNNLMYILVLNSTTNTFQVYSSPLVTGGTQPTWTGPLLSLSANATFFPNDFRATTSGIFVGEYTGVTDITGGPSLYRSTDGTNFTRVLGPLGTHVRHIHAVYEDPYNHGTIYVTVGDGIAPYAPLPGYIYRSTDGGATFNPLPNFTSGGAGTWQAVSLGFGSNYIWAASDQVQGGGAYLFTRTGLTPQWASLLKPQNIAVPGGAGRSVVDLVANATTTITSTTANFTAADVGRLVSGPNVITEGSYITAVTNATTATISVAATGSGTVTAWIRDAFYTNAYIGAMDDTTGYFYTVANDTSTSGNVAGLFVYTQAGANPILLRPIFGANLANSGLYIDNGYALIGRYAIPLPNSVPLP